MDYQVYDNTMTYREYCDRTRKHIFADMGRLLTEDEFDIVIGRFAKVIDGPIGLDDGKVVAMESRLHSSLDDVGGEIFYMGFVGPRGYVIRGKF